MLAEGKMTYRQETIHYFLKKSFTNLQMLVFKVHCNELLIKEVATFRINLTQMSFNSPHQELQKPMGNHYDSMEYQLSERYMDYQQH